MFPVNLRWFRVLVLCSAATKDCCLIHGINPECRKTFLEINFPLESHRDFPRRISSENVHRKTIPHQPKGKQVWQVETDKIMAQFQCRLLRQDRWPLVVQYRWNYTRIMWSDSKDSKCRNLQLDKFTPPASFLVWKTRFKTQVMMWIKRSGDGWFFGWAKIFTISIQERFSGFWDAGRKDCLGCQQDHPEFPVQKKGQPRGAECPTRGPVPERETNRLHDLRLLSSDCCSWHSVRFFWFILGYSSHWQRSGIRYEMARSSVIDDKNSIRWIMGESAHMKDTWLKSVLKLYDLDLHQKKSNPDNQKLKTMVKRSIDTKLRLRNLDARHGKIESGAVGKSRKGVIVFEGRKGTCYQWKEKGQCSQGDCCSFRHVTQDRAQKPEHTAATAKVTVDTLLDNRPDIIWLVPARELLMNIGIRPSAIFFKQKRVVRRETRVCFLITKLMNNKTKGWKNTSHKSRESEDKGVVAIAKSVSQLGCVSQESDALVSQGTKEFRGDPMQKVLNAIRKVRFTKSTMRQASIREKKGPSLGKTKSFLVSEVPTLQNSRIGPTKRLDDNSDESKTRLGILSKNIYKLKGFKILAK